MRSGWGAHVLVHAHVQQPRRAGVAEHAPQLLQPRRRCCAAGVGRDQVVLLLDLQRLDSHLGMTEGWVQCPGRYGGKKVAAGAEVIVAEVAGVPPA